jgi:pimeloyl-ACP methyl ester carboxylesterase
MADVVAGGVRFHVQQLDPPGPVAGAPTVVFVHGLVIDNLSSFYYTLAGPVAGAGARALLYDLRGHGMSERPPLGYSTSDGAADLCALLDALGVTDPVYLIGNSYGGAIAARMAVAAPERVAGLVLVEAECAGAGAAAWFEDMANTLTVAALGLEYDRVQDWLRAVGQRKLAAERPLDATELAAISCPVLGVYGERSELVGAAGDLSRHVPDCRIEILPGLAHTVLREATNQLRDIVTGWLPVTDAVVAAG